MPAFPLRARPWWTTAAAFAAGVAIVQFCTRSFLWFLPYNVPGFVNEVAVLGLAALVGLGVYVLRRRHASPPPLRLSVVAAGALYIVLSSAALGWSATDGLGFGAHRHALFSTPDCEFVARFEQPPQQGRVKGVLKLDEQAGEPPLLYVALLGDVASATAFRAECLPLPEGRDPAAAADKLARGIANWAQQNGLRAAEIALTQEARGRIFRLDGSMGGSILPEQQGKSNRTLVGLRAYVGERSVMTVYVFQPQADAFSADAIAFLDGVARR